MQPFAAALALLDGLVELSGYQRKSGLRLRLLPAGDAVAPSDATPGDPVGGQRPSLRHTPGCGVAHACGGS